MAAYIQLPWFGVKDQVFTKIQRMAGYDGLIYPGFDTNESQQRNVIANADACLKPMGKLNPCCRSPLAASGPDHLKNCMRCWGTKDFGIVPGRAVFSHPQGPRGGAASLRQGWEAVSRGMTLEEYAKDHEELRLAIQMHSH